MPDRMSGSEICQYIHMKQVLVCSLFVEVHIFGSESFPVGLLCRIMMGVPAYASKIIDSTAWVASIRLELEAMLSEIFELE